MKNNHATKTSPMLRSAITLVLATAVGIGLTACATGDDRMGAEPASSRAMSPGAPSSSAMPGGMDTRSGTTGTTGGAMSGHTGMHGGATGATGSTTAVVPATGVGGAMAGSAGDSALQSQVQNALQSSLGPVGSGIQVQSIGGVVTLSGTVSSQAEIDRAVQAARTVQGVTDVRTTGLRAPGQN